MLLLLEQLLNGVQLGVTLLLMASGLTLIFGIMNLINLAHGSLFMVGAYVAATVSAATGSFLLGLLAGTVAAGVTGMVVELVVIRRLYARDHLDQVLATFGLILFFNELVRVVWGRQPLRLDVPPWLLGTVEVVPGAPYPIYRLAVIIVGALVVGGLYLLVQRTRLGMWIRAGASDREMIGALGGERLEALHHYFWARGAVGGSGGRRRGAFSRAVQSGMGENILILTFVVIVIGGIGSIRGAVVGSLLVGLTDTLGRAYLPGLLALVLSPSGASAVGASLSAMAIYILMAVVLAWRPQGLFGGGA